MTFDPKNLKKGDRVLAIVTVGADGVDQDGDVVLVKGHFVPASDIQGHAPGYTPKTDIRVGDVVRFHNRTATVLARHLDLAWLDFGDRDCPVHRIGGMTFLRRPISPETDQ